MPLRFLVHATVVYWQTEMTRHLDTAQKSIKKWIILPTVVDGALIALTVQKKRPYICLCLSLRVREVSTQSARVWVCNGVRKENSKCGFPESK